MRRSHGFTPTHVEAIHPVITIESNGVVYPTTVSLDSTYALPSGTQVPRIPSQYPSYHSQDPDDLFSLLLCPPLGEPINTFIEESYHLSNDYLQYGSHVGHPIQGYDTGYP